MNSKRPASPRLSGESRTAGTRIADARWGDRLRALALPAATLLVLAAGGVVRLASGNARAAMLVWMVGLVVTGAPVVWQTVRGAFAGHFATDLVASLAIVAAVWLEQPIAGLVIVLMQTGGEALERYAEGRASAAVRALEEAAPRLAHRLHGTQVEDVAADAVAVGDLLLVRPGELIPADAVVTEGRSHVDVSRLTGEPVPVTAEQGTRLMSGSANGEGTLTVRALAIAARSQYAHIVALVRSAQAARGRLQRLADRYAMWFTPLTVAVCLVTYALTHDAVRVLAVLVVATPCPLILAAPVAIIGGINRAARRHIIVRNGAALERLAYLDVAVFDKTGTLTVGRPEVRRVVPARGFTARDVFRLAGAVEQGSSHLLARTLVEAAEGEGIVLPPAHGVVEAAGRGVAGEVDERAVIIGARSFVVERYPATATALDALDQADGLRAYVAVDGGAAGIVEYADRIRPETHAVLDALSRLGIRRMLLLSGDHTANAKAVAAITGIGEAVGDLLAEDKVRMVRQLVADGNAVLVVGDGTNDAPALSSATVGVALAGHGGGITAEAADVVVLADDLGRVPEAVRISQRTMRIARESIWAGLGLSGAAMVFAALGHIAPVIGAVLQEVIDVAVILNALRASR